MRSSEEIFDEEKTSAKKFCNVSVSSAHSAFAPGTTTEDATPSLDSRTMPVPLETFRIDSEYFKLIENSLESISNNHFPSSSPPALPIK